MVATNWWCSMILKCYSINIPKSRSVHDESMEFKGKLGKFNVHVILITGPLVPYLISECLISINMYLLTWTYLYI